MNAVEQLKESKILSIMTTLVAFATGSNLATSGSAGPWGPWPFP
ncbi:MAG: hypothetical protein ACTSRW_08425 [Candidatus Helarchaeota archaeon]